MLIIYLLQMQFSENRRDPHIVNRFLNWLILTIRTVALIPGKVNYTRLSMYARSS